MQRWNSKVQLPVLMIKYTAQKTAARMSMYRVPRLLALSGIAMWCVACGKPPFTLGERGLHQAFDVCAHRCTAFIG